MKKTIILLAVGMLCMGHFTNINAKEVLIDTTPYEEETVYIENEFLIKETVNVVPILPAQDNAGAEFVLERERYYTLLEDENHHDVENPNEYSTSFKVYSSIYFVTKHVLNPLGYNDYYYKVTGISGGYDQLDPRCQFISSTANFGILGQTMDNDMFELEKNYNTGTKDFWTYDINAEYVLGSGDSIAGLISIKLTYNYTMGHGSNRYQGSLENIYK